MANRTVVSGTVNAEPVFSHLFKQESFFKFVIAVSRTSGYVDEVPCTISGEQAKKIHVGDKITVEGEIRTCNSVIQEKSNLQTFLYVEDVAEYAGRDINQVQLDGYVCMPCAFRKALSRKDADSGNDGRERELASTIISCERNVTKRRDYIPCVFWNTCARVIANKQAGVYIRIIGRFQSRTYPKRLKDGNKETRVAYEVSVYSLDVVKESEGY